MKGPEEKRQMGTLGLIVSDRKETQHGTPEKHVFVVKDKATIEIAAGFPQWTGVPKKGWRWGVPGGGRKELQTGMNGLVTRSEVIHETLQREFQEEVGIQFFGMESSGIQRLLYPFLVGQWRSVNKGETSVPQIDMFAVAGITVFFDTLSRIEQSILDSLVSQERATWMALHECVSLFEAVSGGKVTVGDEFRPQVLTAAYQYNLSLAADAFSRKFEAALAEAKRMNSQTHAFLMEHTEGYIFNNGTFAADGTLKTGMSDSDNDYLFGEL